MAFPLINPKTQFFDSSGSPLSSGTIEFRSPSTNDLIDSFPTADDADAQTNANANPLTLDASGRASVYLEDGVKYKIILKDADGVTIWTEDDVRSPLYSASSLSSSFTQEIIGEALYPITTAETNAGVTPTDYSYPPGNVLRYGANTAPGTTNTTTAIQAAITSMLAGGVVTVPPGTYLSDKLLVTAGTGVHIVGYGATIRWTNAGVTTSLQIETTSKDITIEGLSFLGDGLGIANRQLGVNIPDDAATDVSDVLVKNCNFQSLDQGVSFFVDALGAAKNLTVDGCTFKDMEGVIGGTGYGVQFNMGNTIGGWKVINSFFENCHRHAIYFSRPRNGLIANNTINTHRVGDGNSDLAAISIARGRDVDCIGNTIRASEDTAIAVAPDETATLERAENINISNNVIHNGDAVDIRIGSGSPASNGALKNITVQGNIIYRDDATNFENSIELFHSLGANILNNVIVAPTSYASIYSSMRIIGSGETSGTSNYTNNVVVSGNVFTQDGTNPRPIRIDDLAANSGAIMRFDSNIFPGSGSGAQEFHIPGTTHSNTNITVIGQNSRGLTEGDWTFPKVKTFATSDATPSVLRGNVFATADTTTITDFDDGVPGQEITVQVKHSMTFAMSGDLGGSSADIVCVSGDLVKWQQDSAGATWWLVAFVDSSVDNSGGA